MIVVSFCYALVLSLALVFGEMLDTYGDMSWSKDHFLLAGMLSFGIAAIVCIVFKLIDGFQPANDNIRWSQGIRVITFLFIFVPQAFVSLVTFPGVYANDAAYLILEIVDPGLAITSRWSVAYTCFLGGLVQLSLVAFGDPTIGFAVCMVLQAIVLSLIATRIRALRIRIIQEYGGIRNIHSPFCGISSIFDRNSVLGSRHIVWWSIWAASNRINDDCGRRGAVLLS